MRRFLDFAIRIMVVAALCAGMLVTARTGRVAATPFAVRPSHSSPQTTFFVTNLNDSGSESLRQAILDANINPGEDLINITAIGTLNLLSALPTITEAVTIVVEDAHVFRIFKIDGQNLYRGLTIANVPVTISGLIVQNAVAFGTLPGGGISSAGDLTLNAVHVLYSSAGSGGGVSSTGSVLVNGGLYKGNSAEEGGGAIYAGGSLIVNESTIQNNQCLGSGCVGGGLYADHTLTLTNTQIISNTTAGGGGGLYADDALVITGTLFISNTAFYSAGGVAVNGPVQLTNSIFENNSCGGSGGGLLATTVVPITMTNVDFVNNSAGGSGGGLMAQNVVMTDTSFISNTASASAGGAYVFDNIATSGGSFENNVNGGLHASNMVLTDTRFINNSGYSAAYADGSVQATNVLFANNPGPGPASGLFGVRITLSDSQFVNNSGTVGGIRADGALTVTNSLFVNNTGNHGGAIQVSGNMMISSTLFLGNSAQTGGGVAHLSGDGSIANSLFAGNTASESGAAVSLEGTGTDTLKHVTIASSELVTTTAITTSKEIVLIQNAIVANHAVGLNVTTGFVVLNHDLFHDNGLDIQGTVASDENRVTGDPLFVNPGADDFHLQPGSPAIDAGLDAGVTVDFEGDGRPSLNGFDVGFDEVVLNQMYRVMLPIILR